MPRLAAATAVLLAGSLSIAPGTAVADTSAQVVAGTGTPGSAGDGGPATAASLSGPAGVAAGADGTIFISDAGNHVVRAVAPDGAISTVAGNGQAGEPGAVVAPNALATDVALGSPNTLTVGPDGTLYIVDTGQRRIYAVSVDRRLTVVAQSGSVLQGIAVGADGTVYAGNSGDRRVVTADAGRLTVVAGNGQGQVTAAGGPATEVAVPAPNSLAAGSGDTVWIASGQLLHRLSGGRIGTVTVQDGRWNVADDPGWPPAQPALNAVAAVTVGGDAVYVFDQDNASVRRLGADGTVTTVAELKDTLQQPAIGPITATADGRILIVDGAGHRVYAVRPDADAPGGDADETGNTRLYLLTAGGVALLALLVGSLLIIRGKRRTLGDR
jgi:hypothetical protein